ncbi:chitin deacetylase 7-like [Daphnia pulex]|uniref:chitin deacetylase 7-like n=1 Tax=Daphnia pulex TaxID=6669 RepID=UPI001EE0C7BF|nr:chitin deacetylase 7-like [Daphnia pulex]
MQRILAVIFFLAVFLNQSQAQCNSTNCVGPACRCMSTSSPGGLTKAQTPQLVFLAFDGAIATTNYDNYTFLLNKRINPNGCPIGMTFFVFHEYNDYSLTHSLYFKRQEIATHSMSHLTPAATWASKSVAEWTDEIGGIRDALSKFANIPKAEIRGARAPFLQSSGDATFTAMKNLGMFYDCSFPTTENTNPPVWPYTLDQGFQHECAIPPCPKGKFPGVWTVPMVTSNRNGTICSMADACDKPNTLDETYQYLMDNFQRHYTTSKAPFGIYLTANAWFQGAEYRLQGYKKFLDALSTKDDVYIVPIARGLDWMKNPKPLAEVPNFFSCPTMTQTPCSSYSCYYEGDASPVGSRNMKSCVTCPDVYPWTGNPLGLP